MDIQLTTEEMEISFSEQTNDMCLVQILRELKQMEQICADIEKIGEEKKTEMKQLEARILHIRNNKDLKTLLGNDSHYWAVRMDSIRNSIAKLECNNKNIDFTFVKKYYDKVVENFTHIAWPHVFGANEIKKLTECVLTVQDELLNKNMKNI